MSSGPVSLGAGVDGASETIVVVAVESVSPLASPFEGAAGGLGWGVTGRLGVPGSTDGVVAGLEGVGVTTLGGGAVGAIGGAVDSLAGIDAPVF